MFEEICEDGEAEELRDREPDSAQAPALTSS